MFGEVGPKLQILQNWLSRFFKYDPIKNNLIIGNTRNTKAPTPTNGSRNTGLGTNVLNVLVNGNDSTAFGYTALQSATGGSNTAVGSGAGSGISSGTGTFVGYNAGTNATTGSGIVCVGDSSNVDSASASNRIAIGSTASCTSDNSVQLGNTSVTGGKIGNSTILLSGGALGIPSSGTLTNCAGYTDANVSFSDITTGNVSTSSHGFTPKLSNNASQYFDGTGAYSTPVGTGWTLGTPQVSTSGTTITLSNIAAGAKVVQVMFSGVSTSGTSHVQVQIGPSGGVVSSGYLGASSAILAAVATANFTAGAVINGNSESTTTIRHGTITFTLENSSSNTWSWFGVLGYSNTAETVVTAGSIALSGALNKISVTTINGTDTFDAGEINNMYM